MVDIDENEGLSDTHKIQAVPTILFVKKGKVLRRVVGFGSYEDLSKHAKRLGACESSSATSVIEGETRRQGR